MLIGELAEAVGLPTQTIRFYERRGLLPDPGRGSNGYRVYDHSTLTRLDFIRSAQAAGLTLAEIGSVLDLREDGTVPCAHVAGLVESKLAGVRARIRDLAVLEVELEGLLERSQRLDPAHCTDAEICHILSAARAAEPPPGAQPDPPPS
jgi:MerR family mercuric resistance operon transcriptional regulator